MNNNIRKLNFFISYSHKNMKYKEKFLISLEALRQSYNIEPWHDGMIDAGGNIDDNIRKALENANVILLLVTDDFLASYYCMKIELEAALIKQNDEKCIIIPVMYQESVLSDTLAFFQNNRVPEDGKPIATGFRNQSLGCTRAVNMIQNMIDNKFPNCKRPTSTYNHSKVSTAKAVNKKPSSSVKKPRKTTNGSNGNNTCYIELYKDGKLAHIKITQSIIDLIPKYHTSINLFRSMLDQSLLDAKKRYTQLLKSNKGIIISNSKKLSLFRLFLMDICAYTKTYITENVGIKVHFRVSKDNYYLGLIASTDADDKTDLSSDWTIKMTPIPMYQGLIYHSSRLNAPLLKSLNGRINYKCNNNDIWKDYVTFTFKHLHSGQTPLISYCISVHKDYYKAKSDMLKILAYLNFGAIVEKYIIEYNNICKNLDKNYDLTQIINTL